MTRTMLARGLLISAWLSFVIATPVPQGGGEAGNTNYQGIGGTGGGQGGGGRLPIRGRGDIGDHTSSDSEEADSSLSIPEQPNLFSRE
ncbi:hypothetical protein TWF506_001102 [Arthrobotrys conoides]|uniref:Secreted protein n=1 Tax=Arthrobotrys conoides TaxID=74498 RepID=A0AAN8RXK2_9PEZI